MESMLANMLTCLYGLFPLHYSFRNQQYATDTYIQKLTINTMFKEGGQIASN